MFRASTTIMRKGKRVRIVQSTDDDSPEAKLAVSRAVGEEARRLLKLNEVEAKAQKTSYRKKKSKS